MTIVSARRRAPAYLALHREMISSAKEMNMERIAILRVDVQLVAAGLRASLIVGSYVYNDADETIGHVDDLMIGDESQVEYAILSVGGFLGLGSHLVAVSFDSLEISDDRILLRGATREELESLPKFEYR